MIESMLLWVKQTYMYAILLPIVVLLPRSGLPSFVVCMHMYNAMRLTCKISGRAGCATCMHLVKQFQNKEPVLIANQRYNHSIT